MFLALVVEPGLAHRLAGQIRQVYCNPARFRLFDDTLPVLDDLASRGWTHLMLSNHVPELGEFLRPLALSQRLAAVYNSAEIGYEKPHPATFRRVLDLIGVGAPVWMIGDNYQADILGAAGAGIPGILVRKPHEAAQRFCPDLSGVAALVEQSMHSPG